jgi:GalNAc5-diNAcBac-PP-undecaprenol beta-1,3-glucosyltransferase
MTAPALSVIVPTYRRPEALARALASARAACSEAMELIVIDDSPDGEGFAPAQAHRARYLNKGGQSRGLSASRNLGLQLASAPVLGFLDDDDHFALDGLQALLSAARREGGIVFGDHGAYNHQARQVMDRSGITLQDLLVCNRLPVGSYLMPRAAVVQPFDERLRSHEDWDFLLAHATRSGLTHVPGVVAWIDKTHNQGQTTEQASMQARRRSLFWLDFMCIYARYPALELSEPRSAMLRSLGMDVPASLLAFEDSV